MRRFDDRVCVVTGAARGIGLATARRLAGEGARVVLADIDAVAVARAAGELLAAGAPGVCPRECDVSDEAHVAATLDAAIERFGRLDVVVNNAAIMIFHPLAQFPTSDWRRVFAVNLDGPFFFVKHALSRMGEGGAIVNVASVHAGRTQALVAPYAAAKAGLLSLTRSAAIEAQPKGIRVNAVVPGAVDTDMLWSNENVASGAETVDRKFLCRPEDVASAVAYLASDDARCVQGAALHVDGGRGARI